MQAAVLLSALPEPAPGAARETGPGHLAVFDDPEEWATFSQPADPTLGKSSAAATAATGLWESQVVVRGMQLRGLFAHAGAGAAGDSGR